MAAPHYRALKARQVRYAHQAIDVVQDDNICSQVPRYPRCIEAAQPQRPGVKAAMASQPKRKALHYKISHRPNPFDAMWAHYKVCIASPGPHVKHCVGAGIALRAHRAEGGD
jgi:hypothetical protein